MGYWWDDVDDGSDGVAGTETAALLEHSASGVRAAAQPAAPSLPNRPRTPEADADLERLAHAHPRAAGENALEYAERLARLGGLTT